MTRQHLDKKWAHWIIDNGLLAIILVLVAWAHINGKFIQNTVQVVEVCYGTPTNNSITLPPELQPPRYSINTTLTTSPSHNND